MGEFDLIARLAGRLEAPRTPGSIGIGDDCAAIRSDGGFLLFTTDAAVSGRHFLPGLTPWVDVGWRLGTASASDVAACGGHPSAALCSIGVPADFPPQHLEAIYDGLADAARYYGFDVLGGNVTGAAELWLDLAMIGRTPRFISRGGAKPGDLVVVTGPLGDSAAGLALLQSRVRGGSAPAYAETLVQRHLHPKARTDLAEALRAAASSAIDVSDGLASELHHLATRSKARISIDRNRILFSPELAAYAKDSNQDPVHLALHSGEEYQLIFTVPRGGNLAPFGAMGTRIIGEVQAGSGVLLDGEPLQPRGWDHLQQGQ